MASPYNPTRRDPQDIDAADRPAGAAPASLLAFLAGGRYWLVDLSEVHEVVSRAEITPVPWTKPWFVGLTSVRGTIYACTDLAVYLGLHEPSERGESRLLIAHPRFGINAALRVERALGLRNLEGMRHLGSDADGAEEAGRWEDANGRVWWGFSFGPLVADPEFLQAGL